MLVKQLAGILYDPPEDLHFEVFISFSIGQRRVSTDLAVFVVIGPSSLELSLYYAECPLNAETRWQEEKPVLLRLLS